MARSVASREFETSLVLARVMTSGVVMSIERNERELQSLQRLLHRLTGRRHASLTNSRTAAIHAALAGRGIGYGDEISAPALDERARAFVEWLGVGLRAPRDAHDAPPFAYVDVQPGMAPDALGGRPDEVLVLDLTGVGFGPAAAMLTDDAEVWARAERLKIFGAFDLRTMWTQARDDSVQPAVQFNYRLSPLVAACIRMRLQQFARAPAARGSA